MTEAQQKKFDLEYPKAQLFSKTDLAKFEYSSKGLPHIVSRGAQKNFSEFAGEIGDSWAKSDGKYDELWYRRLIAKAIIFRKLEAEVPKQPWYEGGYRANIVTYAMAKVFHDATSETYALDLDAVWKRQAISDALLRALLLAAAEAHDAITNPPTGVRNMSEWAKKQGCWDGLKIRKLEYDNDFETCLLLNESARTAERDQKKKTRLTEGINFQTEVVNLGAPFWHEVLEWGRSNKKLTSKDQQILQICSSMPRRVPRDYEAQHAMNVLQRLKEQGFLHASQ